ncbi:MAG: GNAT family N-acetyltransferase [Alphaproteobacteria bacterium]|nr:GNAT family N-acetyltransferase [Alphaproteobacteria bacterium]
MILIQNIKTLTLDDFAILRMFHVKHFHEYYISDNSFTAYLSQPQYTTYGMFHVKRLIGYAIFLNGGVDADIIYIATSPKFRRYGVASALIARYITDYKISNLFIEVEARNTIALRFYNTNSFEIIGVRRKYINGHDAYLMVKRLAKCCLYTIFYTKILYI